MTAPKYGLLWLALPLGAVVLACAARLAPAPELHMLFFIAGCLMLSLGLWTAPELLETAARRSAALRGLAGAGRALLRPPLAAAACALAVWTALRSGRADEAMTLGFFFGGAALFFSCWFVFRGWPSMFAAWRRVGMLRLERGAQAVAPGGVAGATAVMNRRCAQLSARLVLYDSASKEKDSRAAAYPAEVSAPIELDGAWNAHISARVPDDAAPTKEDDKDGVWRYWELEVVAEGGWGPPTRESDYVTVSAKAA